MIREPLLAIEWQYFHMEATIQNLGRIKTHVVLLCQRPVTSALLDINATCTDDYKNSLNQLQVGVREPRLANLKVSPRRWRGAF
jgi:hypothetical protein